MLNVTYLSTADRLCAKGCSAILFVRIRFQPSLSVIAQISCSTMIRTKLLVALGEGNSVADGVEC